MKTRPQPTPPLCPSKSKTSMTSVTQSDLPPTSTTRVSSLSSPRQSPGPTSTKAGWYGVKLTTQRGGGSQSEAVVRAQQAAEHRPLDGRQGSATASTISPPSPPLRRHERELAEGAPIATRQPRAAQSRAAVCPSLMCAWGVHPPVLSSRTPWLPPIISLSPAAWSRQTR